jgi:L-threonylcarbamoyladenylate synthase
MSVAESEIAAGAALIREGRLVAFPTETVYGLGADATNDRAVAAVYAAKGRPLHNPLITHVTSIDAALRLAGFNAHALRLAETFWPGPLTLVLPRRPDCAVSLLASAGLETIAVRIPAHAMARALIDHAGVPLVAPSANPSGRTSPTLAAHVREGLGSRVALIIDGGPSSVGIESTVVRSTGDRPTLLRPGGVPREAIVDALGGISLAADGEDASRPHAPGQIEGHYATKARIILDVVWPRFDVGLLAFGPTVPRHPGPVRNLSPGGDLVEAAANLFRMLHELDATGVETIAVMAIPRDGLGEAINDRLVRAAAPFHR